METIYWVKMRTAYGEWKSIPVSNRWYGSPDVDRNLTVSATFSKHSLLWKQNFNLCQQHKHFHPLHYFSTDENPNSLNNYPIKTQEWYRTNNSAKDLDVCSGSGSTKKMILIVLIMYSRNIFQTIEYNVHLCYTDHKEN